MHLKQVSFSYELPAMQTDKTDKEWGVSAAT